MAELIDKKAITESRDILDVLELFELTPYISAENLIKFVDNLPSITEAEIRAKAIDDFVNAIEEYYFKVVDSPFMPYLKNINLVSEPNIRHIAEQLKGE